MKPATIEGKISQRLPNPGGFTDSLSVIAKPLVTRPMFTIRIRGLMRAMLAVCALLAAGPAPGQALDSVDVQRRANEVEITVRFATQVQYLRHAPPDFGKSLRIYLRLSGFGIQESDIRPETKRPPKTEGVPQFTVSYPELDGAMLIAFDQPIRFTVRPGSDGRSISILVPVLPGG